MACIRERAKARAVQASDLGVELGLESTQVRRGGNLGNRGALGIWGAGVWCIVSGQNTAAGVLQLMEKGPVFNPWDHDSFFQGGGACGTHCRVLRARLSAGGGCWRGRSVRETPGGPQRQFASAAILGAGGFPGAR